MLIIPGKGFSIGRVHPISFISDLILDFFFFSGFRFVSSPEVDNTKNCFDILGIKPSHPARSLKDTFYFSPNLVLRTHTSNVQSRELSFFPNTEQKVITIGKVYRKDTDDSVHTHQFTQMECFRVGKNVSFKDLKNIIVSFLKQIFSEKKIVYRFRPSYFPFTVPSIEVDIECFFAKKTNCSVCQNTGWIEILGAGLINQEVLKRCGYSESFSGYAFGVGIERLLMIKYGISDIRYLYINNLNFLKQFSFF